MIKGIPNELSFDKTQLIRCVMQGMSLAEIGKKMCVSTSSVSYYLNQLFKIYGVRNRSELITHIISKIVDGYNHVIADKNMKINTLQNENEDMKNLITGLISNLDDPIISEHWLKEIKKYL